MTREQWESVINVLAAGDFLDFVAGAHLSRLDEDEWYRLAKLRNNLRSAWVIHACAWGES